MRARERGAVVSIHTQGAQVHGRFGEHNGVNVNVSTTGSGEVEARARARMGAAESASASGSPADTDDSGPSTSDASGPSSSDAPVGPDGRPVRDPDAECWRKEGQDPKYHVGVCTVGTGTHKGMRLNIYEIPRHLYAVHGPSARSFQTTYYMHPSSREFFPLLEHWQTGRTADGLPNKDGIRLKEAKIFDGSLTCAICGRVPTQAYGAKWFRIDSLHEDSPSKTALRNHDFQQAKIARGHAHIICTECEQTKTIQGSPFAKGSSRNLRVPL